MKAIAFVLLFFTCSVANARDYSSWLKNCSKYRETVESMLEKENVSKDYYYLMVAESRCTLKAESHKGARGFWQLMPRTGKHYGCSNLDDIECSTRAAILYIKHLQSTFRTFKDVIFAYNMGGHNYKRNGATNEAIGLYNRVLEIKGNDSE